MIRGTTPTLTFTLPFKVEIIDKISITFSQSGKEVLSVDNKRCELSGDTVTVKLTQEDTLLFVANCYAEIQIRILTTTADALASHIIKTPVQNILKGGVI